MELIKLLHLANLASFMCRPRSANEAIYLSLWLGPQSVFSRYSNLFPYDSSRVTVQGSDSDYVNASWLSVAGVGHRMILAMGPLHPDYHGQDTVASFWRMVQQQGVRQVVMLCQVEILLLPSG